jgi:hypothetical protein
MAFWLKILLSRKKQMIIRLKNNAYFFRRKMVKIAKNSDHNINPWSARLVFFVFNEPIWILKKYRHRNREQVDQMKKKFPKM